MSPGTLCCYFLEFLEEAVTGVKPSRGEERVPEGRVIRIHPSARLSFLPEVPFLQQPTTSEHTKADARHVQTQGTNRGAASAAFSA